EYVKSYDWAQRVDVKQDDLVTLSHSYDYIYDLFLIDTKGNLLFSLTHEADLGTNLLNGPYANTLFASSVKTTLETGHAVFSDLERYAPSNNVLAGFITAPLLDEFGSKIGVFAIQIRVDRVLSLLKPQLKEKTSLIHYLVGEDGKLRTVINDKEHEILNRVIRTEQFNLWQQEHGKHGKEQDEQQESAFEYLGPNGQSVIGQHQMLRLPGTNWVLISEIDQDEALASAIWLARVTLLLVFFTIVIVVTLAIYQARRITGPIISLADASMKVAEGETDQQVEILVNNEIGKLAEAFNHMLLTRQVYEEELKQSSDEANQALEELAEQKFALDQHSIVSITDLKGVITFVNSKFSEISGYSCDELIGHDHRIINSGYHDNEFFQQMYQIINTGKVWHGEVCNKSKNGQFYWLDTTIVPFMGKNGKPQSYVSIHNDITERKLAESELIEQKFVLDQHAIVSITDIQGIITYANDRFVDISGYNRDELIGQNHRILNSGFHESDFFRDMYRTIARGDVWQSEICNKAKDGRLYWVDSTIVPFKGVDGKPQSYISIRTDITERKKAEAELISAKEIAEDALQVKGEFLASMSHEIRTP
ncbi:MAG: PAS domain S-box protein, partial [Gammaproteobacteria bacterium]|nr:PAS domain S-box protein [Gammaproteobacteria bacterium]